MKHYIQTTRALGSWSRWSGTLLGCLLLLPANLRAQAPMVETGVPRPIPSTPAAVGDEDHIIRIDDGLPPQLPSTPAPLPPLSSEPQQPVFRQPFVPTGFQAVQPVPPPVPPRPPAAEPSLPVPQPGAGGSVRLPRMAGVVGGTPQPTQETLQEYRNYVQQVVNPEVTFDLVVNRSRLMILKEKPVRVQIGDDKVAGQDLITPTELSLIGRSIGTTVLNIWFKDKILSYLVRVFPDPEAKERQEAIYRALADEVNHAFPESHISLYLLGDKLAVCGQAKDVADAVQILRTVRANAPNETQRIPVDNANLNLNVNVPTGALNPDDPTAPTLQNLFLAAGPNIINMLRIPGEQQVMLRVVVAEVNRAAARSIGVNFSITNSNGTTVFQQLTGGLLGPNATAGGTGAATGSSATGASGANLPVMLDNGRVSIAINALRTLNLARSLAEPNLVTMNGRAARFQAGGEFPVPVVTGFTAAGLQGVSFVPFGVQLSFLPVITDHDRIRLSVQANVSTRDLATTATVGTTAVPGLNTRNFSTQVELREGQTLAVAGLIQNNLGSQATRVPLFGDLPIIGRLFAVDSTSASEQELVILVTPELVHPLEPKECPTLPGSDLIEPSDLEFYLLGRLEGLRKEDYRSPIRNNVARMARFRCCEDTLISGPHGYSGGPKP